MVAVTHDRWGYVWVGGWGWGGKVEACLCGCVWLSDESGLGLQRGRGVAPWMAQLQVVIRVLLLVGACLPVCRLQNYHLHCAC